MYSIEEVLEIVSERILTENRKKSRPFFSANRIQTETLYIFSENVRFRYVRFD